MQSQIKILFVTSLSLQISTVMVRLGVVLTQCGSAQYERNNEYGEHFSGAQSMAYSISNVE